MTTMKEFRELAKTIERLGGTVTISDQQEVTIRGIAGIGPSKMPILAAAEAMRAAIAAVRDDVKFTHND